MISALLHRLGRLFYRVVFFSAACYLLWRSATDADGTTALVSLGLGSLCLLQFVVLMVVDYRRAQRQMRP